MAGYKQLCESILTMKTTKVSRYPKQIQLSEEFQQALKNEIVRFTVIDEDKDQPIRNFEEKFLKALHFEITEQCKTLDEGKKQTTPSSKDTKNRDAMRHRRKDPEYSKQERTKNKKRMAGYRKTGNLKRDKLPKDEEY